MMHRRFLGLGAFFAGTGVILGAFAAHGLKKVLSPYLLDVFQTGVHYQFIHSIALILVSLMMLHLKTADLAQKYFKRAGICFTIGILCFSGSLYLLALTGVKWFGPITPLGGLFFIIGWMMLLIASFKMKEVSQ
ncbi:DUF423 domain-containing protein [Vibrio sp.]|uniref:DUF423 domain-containing protein n=1 Tax=Vibrio viridaestus TaxID=2487322 RepID=A0A3N9TFD2_9VIBR|nr:DUF423 domain-containing protein [Vibrio viridaestus]MDC0610428.1 DUF423 domain-containing protein [Vibrio sp.]RQW62433.1 DUF423 domain-containing protein [Vibrio viridaestus]